MSARAALLASAVGSAAALLLAVWVGFAGPLSVAIPGPGGDALPALYFDRLTSILLLLVFGVTATVQAFASRYLAGDVRAGRFFWASTLLLAATAAMVSAATLVGLALAWTLAGAALCTLLGVYAGFPDADEGVRRTRRAFAVGDGALWAAVAVALVAWGNLDLRDLGGSAAGLDPGGGALTAVACLVLVAALARSAQLPLQGWLPATLAAPTPVSALLHAGVVNAGGILLVRLAPIFGASPAATHLAFLVGAATAVYGTALMLTKPDVKGALAHSTIGQMGFMIMTCGLGAYAAAIFHLVGHGMYKASLFLGSGGAIRGRVRAAKAPPPPRPARAGLGLAALSLLIPAGALALAAAIVQPHLGGADGGGVLLVFALATGAWLTRGWLRRRPGLGGFATAAALGVLAALAYVAGITAFAEFLRPALAGAGTAGVPPLAATAALVPLAGLAALRRPPRSGWWRQIAETAYVWALELGHVVPGEAGRGEGWRPRRRGLATLRTAPEGAAS
ncbi:MAG: proton-conducting transporter membrane subunit [Solirubrobacterales bacterium]